MEIEKWILKNLKELDKNFPDSINLQDSFSDYGMTSAQSIIMIERLKDFLDKEININDLWRYSTIEGFIDSLCEVRLEDVYRDEKIDINSLENAENEEYAIIGMGCRFPDADNIEEFWENLLKGRDSISKRKFDKKELAGGFINNPDMFDNMFFRISPREAENMDPQQRHLLEVTWETFEDANIKPEEYYGREVGVFVGICGNDYSNDLFATSNITDIYSITGNSYAIASNRLSYFYNFTGPSMSLDTACSSSLVATHYACMSLKNNDCEMALVGGVNLILNDSITDIL